MVVNVCKTKKRFLRGIVISVKTLVVFGLVATFVVVGKDNNVFAAGVSAGDDIISGFHPTSVNASNRDPYWTVTASDIATMQAYGVPANTTTCANAAITKGCTLKSDPYVGTSKPANHPDTAAYYWSYYSGSNTNFKSGFNSATGGATLVWISNNNNGFQSNRLAGACPTTRFKMKNNLAYKAGVDVSELVPGTTTITIVYHSDGGGLAYLFGEGGAMNGGGNGRAWGDGSSYWLAGVKGTSDTSGVQAWAFSGNDIHRSGNLTQYGVIPADKSLSDIDLTFRPGDCVGYTGFAVPSIKAAGTYYKYALDPTTNAGSATVSSGNTAVLRNSVAKTGDTISKDTDVKVAQFTIGSGDSRTFDDGTKDGDYLLVDGVDPQSAFLSGVDDFAWKNLSGTAAKKVFSSNSTDTSGGAWDVLFNSGNYPAGTRLCSTIAVRDWASRYSDVGKENANYSYWRYSKPACVVVGRTPQMQIRGADSWSGGMFKEENASCTVMDSARLGGFSGATPSAVRGSWSQYGLTSLGVIAQFGSAGFTMVDSNKLDFANNTGTYGEFMTAAQPTRCLSAIYSHYSALVSDTITTAQAADPSTLGSGVYAVDGDVAINGFSLAKGKHITLLVRNGTVTINGNIQFENTGLQSISEIPSFTLVAYRSGAGNDNGQIVIGNDVTSIDGVYAAYNRLATCAASPEKSPVNDVLTNDGACKNRLQINGAIITRDQILRRTAGGTTTEPSSPAEVVNYRPDLFLTTLAGTDGKNYQLYTSGIRELPPRY